MSLVLYLLVCARHERPDAAGAAGAVRALPAGAPDQEHRLYSLPLYLSLALDPDIIESLDPVPIE